MKGLFALLRCISAAVHSVFQAWLPNGDLFTAYAAIADPGSLRRGLISYSGGPDAQDGGRMDDVGELDSWEEMDFSSEDLLAGHLYPPGMTIAEVEAGELAKQKRQRKKRDARIKAGEEKKRKKEKEKEEEEKEDPMMAEFELVGTNEDWLGEDYARMKKEQVAAKDKGALQKKEKGSRMTDTRKVLRKVIPEIVKYHNPVTLLSLVGPFPTVSRDFHAALTLPDRQSYLKFLTIMGRFYPTIELVDYLGNLAPGSTLVNPCMAQVRQFDEAPIHWDPREHHAVLNVLGHYQEGKRYYHDYWQRYSSFYVRFSGRTPVSPEGMFNLHLLASFLYTEGRPFWVRPIDPIHFFQIRDSKNAEKYRLGGVPPDNQLSEGLLTARDLDILVPSYDGENKQQRLIIFQQCQSSLRLNDLRAFLYRGLMNPRHEFYMLFGQHLALSASTCQSATALLEGTLSRIRKYLGDFPDDSVLRMPNLEFIQELLRGALPTTPSHKLGLAIQDALTVLNWLTLFAHAIFRYFPDLQAQQGRLMQFKDKAENFHLQHSLSYLALDRRDFEAYIASLFNFLAEDDQEVPISFSDLALLIDLGFDPLTAKIPFTFMELMVIFSPKFHFYPIKGILTQDPEDLTHTILAEYPFSSSVSTS